MNRAPGVRRPANRLLFAALLAGAVEFLAAQSGNAQQAGWTGSAGMGSGCVGWNCDGKSPCTGMSCGNTATPKDGKAGAAKSKGSGSAKSGTAKSAKAPAAPPKRATTATASVPDVGGLNPKSQKSDSWGGSRNADTRTADQRHQPDAKKAVDDIDRALGGGKPAPTGWGSGLKSDSRTIEQKLDTP